MTVSSAKQISICLLICYLMSLIYIFYAILCTLYNTARQLTGFVKVIIATVSQDHLSSFLQQDRTSDMKQQ